MEDAVSSEVSREAFLFDHAVYAAGRLARAVRRLEAAGLTVVEGGRHAGSPTCNALVAFADGTYVELLAAVRPWLPPLLRGLYATPFWHLLLGRYPPLARRFLGYLAAPGGLADYALAVRSLDAVAGALRARGLGVAGPFVMGRTRPDGRVLSWKLAVPAAPELPFLIEDVTPRADRVPSGPATLHPAGVRGLTALEVVVRDLTRSRRRYALLLGRGPGGASGDDFPVGSVTIRLVERPETSREGPAGLTLDPPFPTASDPFGHGAGRET